MFLGPNEHLIIMNLPSHLPTPWGQCVSHTDDDLKRLKDVGAATIMNYCFWNVAEQDGFAFVEGQVEQAARAGLRCLLGAYVEPPEDLPDAYYARQNDGKVGYSENGSKALSIFNTDARAAMLRFYEELIRRCGGPDVLIFNCGLDMGEIVLPHAPSFYDDAALISHGLEVGGRPDLANADTQDWLRRAVVEHFLAIDGLLRTQHDEVWQSLHPWLAWARKPFGANGNFAQEDIFRVERELWPDAARVLLQYTYFNHTKPVRKDGILYKDLIDQWMRTYRLKLVVEGCGCDGLKTIAPIAIQKGFVGQLVGVKHPGLKVDHLQEWQVEGFAGGIRCWGGGA